MTGNTLHDGHVICETCLPSRKCRLQNIKIVQEGGEILQGWDDKGRLGRPYTEVSL